MPTPVTQHPDDFDLLAYAGGKLRTRERGPIEDHLADCGRCVARLDALLKCATPDPLLRRLRVAGESRPADQTPLPGSLAAASWPEVVRQLAAVAHPNLLMPALADPTPADGIDFHALACAENRPAVPTVCDYFRQAATGLAAAHARGVVHGDLRLADLVLFGQATVRVKGFERARLRNRPPPSDPTADIVALGRCFAALLTGRAYGTALETAPAAGLERSLPPDVYRVLRRFTSDGPKRFATMAEVAKGLEALAPRTGKRPTWWQRRFGPAAGDR